MFRKYCPSLFDHWSFNSAFNEQKATENDIEGKFPGGSLVQVEVRAC